MRLSNHKALKETENMETAESTAMFMPASLARPVWTGNVLDQVMEGLTLAVVLGSPLCALLSRTCIYSHICTHIPVDLLMSSWAVMCLMHYINKIK